MRPLANNNYLAITPKVSYPKQYNNMMANISPIHYRCWHTCNQRWECLLSNFLLLPNSLKVTEFAVTLCCMPVPSLLLSRHLYSHIRPSAAAGESVTGSEYSVSRAGTSSKCGAFAWAAGCAHESPPGTSNCSLVLHNDCRDRSIKFVCSLAQLSSLFSTGCHRNTTISIIT